MKRLFVALLLFFVIIILVFTLKSFRRDAVDAHDGLIGITHYDILALGTLLEEANEHTDQPPHATLGKSDLRGEIARTVELRGKDDVLVGVLGSTAADEANLHLRGTREDGLGGPLGELEGVVLELAGEDGTALTVDLVAPVDAEMDLGGVEFIEREGGHVLLVVLGTDLLLDDTVQLGTAHELDVVTEVEAAVTVGDGGGLHAIVILVVVEGVGKVETLASFGRLEDLLGEVLVDHGGLETQALGSVDALGIVLLLPGRLVGGLVDGEVIELRGVALVEEESATRKLLDDNVPGIDGAGARHEMSQDGIGSKYIAHAIYGELLDNWIVHRGDGVEFCSLEITSWNIGQGGDQSTSEQKKCTVYDTYIVTC